MTSTSFRLSEEVRAMIRALAKRFQVSDRDAVERSVRAQIKRDKVSASDILACAEERSDVV